MSFQLGRDWLWVLHNNEEWHLEEIGESHHTSYSTIYIEREDFDLLFRGNWGHTLSHVASLLRIDRDVLSITGRGSGKHGAYARIFVQQHARPAH